MFVKGTQTIFGQIVFSLFECWPTDVINIMKAVGPVVLSIFSRLQTEHLTESKQETHD